MNRILFPKLDAKTHFWQGRMFSLISINRIDLNAPYRFPSGMHGEEMGKPYKPRPYTVKTDIVKVFIASAAGKTSQYIVRSNGNANRNCKLQKCGYFALFSIIEISPKHKYGQNGFIMQEHMQPGEFYVIYLALNRKNNS